MKGRWESNINVWFPYMYSQNWNCYFQNRICLPVPTLIYLWEIYIFPGSVCLFCCRELCGQILEIYKSLSDTWMWKLGLRPRNSQINAIFLAVQRPNSKRNMGRPGSWLLPHLILLSSPKSSFPSQRQRMPMNVFFFKISLLEGGRETFLWNTLRWLY